MIRKISNSEYLKRVGSMTAAERNDLAGRVGEWLTNEGPLLTRRESNPMARLQNVMQLSPEWSEAEQSAWTQGVRLLTAFVGTADTWLPDLLYTKAARRSIRNIIQILSVNVGKLTVKPKSAKLPERKPTPKPTAKATAKTTSAKVSPVPIPKHYTSAINITLPQSDPTPAATAAPATPPKRKRGRPRKNPLPEQTQNANTVAPDAKGVAQGANKQQLQSLSTMDAENVVPRPKHIDQYAYLLPEDTQRRAAQYGPLMRDLGSARENMRLLMNDPKANATERERWAKIAVKIDGQVGAIRRELDSEWQKLVATKRVMVDDLGMAHVIDPATGKVVDPKPKVEIPKDEAKHEKAEPDKPKRSHHKKLPEGEERTKRILYLQKWLRDPRPPKSDEHRKQWEENARELIWLGGNLTDAMRKAAEHYGARIPKVKPKVDNK